MYNKKIKFNFLTINNFEFEFIHAKSYFILQNKEQSNQTIFNIKCENNLMLPYFVSITQNFYLFIF